MRNAIHADLQLQAELLIDTICLSFPVGEKMFLREKICGKIFLGENNLGEKNLLLKFHRDRFSHLRET